MADWLSPDNDSAEQYLQSALQKLETEKRKLTEMQEKFNEESSVIRSKDRSLQMSFDGRGELTGVKFLNTKYRSMAPAELANLIVETTRAGRMEALEKLGETMGNPLSGFNFADLMTGKADIGKAMESLVTPMINDVNDMFGGGRPVMDPGREEGK